jgi:hypothetical protein
MAPRDRAYAFGAGAVRVRISMAREWPVRGGGYTA